MLIGKKLLLDIDKFNPCSKAQPCKFADFATEPSYIHRNLNQLIFLRLS